MANHSARAAYTYEKTPEEKANEALRFKNKIASTETRAQSRVAPIAALRALASKVPPDDLKRILPPGGIHDRMSPADIEAATGRIDQYHQERGVPTPGNPGQQAQAPAAKTFLGLGGSPQAPAQPQASAVRSTPTGGQEQLVQSQSGPRWVGFVNNPPPTSAGRTAAASGRVTDRGSIYEGSADALEVAGSGKRAVTPYGTIASTIPAPAAPQPRAIAGVSPGSAHNDVNTGGNPPAAPAQVAAQPVTAPPSAPVVAPVPTAPVTPFAVGNAIRTIPPAVVGGVMQAGKDMIGRAVGAVRDFGRGLAGPDSPAPAPPAPPAPLATPPTQIAAPPSTAIPSSRFSGIVPKAAPPSPPIPPVAPVAPVGEPPAPAVKSAMNTVDEEEEKRRLAMSSPSNRAFSYA